VFPGGFLVRYPRTVKLYSLGAGARLGALGVGRVRKLRAMEDHSAPVHHEITSEYEGGICNIARRAQLAPYGCHP